MSRYYPVAREGGAQPQYGEKRPRIGRKTIYLDNARDGEEVNIGGDVLWAVRASSYNALLDVAIHEQDQGRVPFQKGTFVRCGPFSQVYLFNEAQSGEWVEIVYARETWDFSIQNPGSTFDTVQTVVPTNLNSWPDKTISASSVGTVRSAKATRKESVIRSLSSNTNTVRVGNGDVGASQGLPLEPGQSLTINTTDIIQAYNLDDAGDGSDVVIAGFDVQD